MAKKRSLPSVPVSEPRKPLQTGENLTKADRQELDPTNGELPQTVTESQTVFNTELAKQALEVLVPLLKRQSCMERYLRIEKYLGDKTLSADDIATANKFKKCCIKSAATSQFD